MSAEAETSEIIRRRLFVWHGLRADSKTVAEYEECMTAAPLPSWFPVRIVRLYCALPKSTEAPVIEAGPAQREGRRGALPRGIEGTVEERNSRVIWRAAWWELEETADWLEFLARAEIVAGDRLQPLRDEMNSPHLRHQHLQRWETAMPESLLLSAFRLTRSASGE